jgi:phage antirepressor YoqD-like protein|nr:MAG TPA: KilAC domain protein [Caudoviricetes sp.]
MNKNELKVNGTQNFMGINIPIVEGGFGKNCRVVTAKAVSEIHNTRLSDINASINRLIEKKRIKEGIDYINLLSETVSLRDFARELGMFSSNRTKDAFILSERGYSKLIKAMDDDESWDIMDSFVDEYFKMREVIKSSEQLKAQLLLSIYDGGQNAVLASKQLTELEVKEATTPLIQQIEEEKPLVDFANQVSDTTSLIDMNQMAKLLKDENIPIGRNRLFEILRQKEILRNNNEPYQRYIESGYFKIKEGTYETPYGTKAYVKTFITGKGQIWITEKLRKEFGKVA